MVVSLVLWLGALRPLMEEIKSVFSTWRRVETQFDKQLGPLTEEIISPEIATRLKS